MCSRWSRLSGYTNLELSQLWYAPWQKYSDSHNLMTLQAHYHLLFEAVLVYLDSFDTYSNFLFLSDKKEPLSYSYELVIPTPLCMNLCMVVV